jgi:hypothetical protein
LSTCKNVSNRTGGWLLACECRFPLREFQAQPTNLHVPPSNLKFLGKKIKYLAKKKYFLAEKIQSLGEILL